MDEILSSIRQIIADDDANAVERPVPVQPTAAPRGFAPVPLRPASSVQHLSEPSLEVPPSIAAEPTRAVTFSELIGSSPAPVAAEVEAAEPASYAAPAPAAEAHPQPIYPSSHPEVAPMSNSRLADMADRLVETGTQSVVQDAFSRLGNMSTIGSNLTIEALVRDMLRPMLKEWLDENLPTLVERMVEQEIARVSRGIR